MMQDNVPEADWKWFRQLRETALQRFCERILEELRGLSSESNKTAHDRYQAVYERLQKRDDDIAQAFNDPRRSQMFRQLRYMRTLGLVNEEELAQFSEETRHRAEMQMKR